MRVVAWVHPTRSGVHDAALLLPVLLPCLLVYPVVVVVPAKVRSHVPGPQLHDVGSEHLQALTVPTDELDDLALVVGNRLQRQQGPQDEIASSGPRPP